MAERVGFEPTVRINAQRLSRPLFTFSKMLSYRGAGPPSLASSQSLRRYNAHARVHSYFPLERLMTFRRASDTARSASRATGIGFLSLSALHIGG